MTQEEELGEYHILLCEYIYIYMCYITLHRKLFRSAQPESIPSTNLNICICMHVCFCECVSAKGLGLSDTNSSAS